MRILVDEDLASHHLLALLRSRLGADRVVEPDRGTSDATPWGRAQDEGLAILTGNARDFLDLARSTGDHAGLLIVVRFNDPTRDLRAVDVAARVARIGALHPEGVANLVLIVNGFEPLGSGGR